MEQSEINFQLGIFCESYRNIFVALLESPNPPRLADEFSRPETDIRRIAEETGIFIDYKFFDSTPRNRYQKILGLLETGMNPHDACLEIGGIAYKTVRLAAKVAKYSPILDALRENPNATAVARQLGNISHVAVCELAKKAGISLQHRTSKPPNNKSPTVIVMPDTSFAAARPSVQKGDISLGTPNTRQKWLARLAKRKKSPAEKEMGKMLKTPLPAIHEILQQTAAHLRADEPSTPEEAKLLVRLVSASRAACEKYVPVTARRRRPSAIPPPARPL